MPFEFVCPFCHHRTRVDDKYAGQTGPCVSCGRHVTMPAFDKRGVLLSQPSSPKPLGSGPKKSKSVMPKILVFVAIGTLLAACATGIYFAVPLVRQKASLAAQRSDASNMRAIAQALNAYAVRYGCYPTPIVKDSNGSPLYSWRVLILPFLGYEELYNRFQLDQPFDSPANLSLTLEMPQEFASRFSNAKVFHETNYALLVGKGTLFPASGPLAPADAEEPTILLVETTDGMCSWTEPGDIDVGMGLSIGSKPMKDIGGIHKGVVIVATVKEEAFAIPDANSQSLIDALATPQGGETVDMTIATEL